MDRRDELAQKCLLVKSVPPETDEQTVKRSIERLARVARVCRYTEHADDSTRFIVQLRSREDASKLIHDDNVFLTTSQGNVKVNIGFCPECILSNDWVDSWSYDLSDDESQSTEESRKHDNSIRHMSSESGDESDQDLFVNDLIKGNNKTGQTGRHDSVRHERTFKDHHDEVIDFQSQNSDEIFLRDKSPIEALITDDMEFTIKGSNLEAVRPQSLYVAGDPDEDDKYIPTYTIPAAPVRPGKHSENTHCKNSENEPSDLSIEGGGENKEKSLVGTVQEKPLENYTFDVSETEPSEYHLEEDEEKKEMSPMPLEKDEKEKAVFHETLPDLEKRMANLDIKKTNDGRNTDMHEAANDEVPEMRDTHETGATELQRSGYSSGIGQHTEKEITTISVKMPSSVEQTKNGVKSTEQKDGDPDPERKTLLNENVKDDTSSSPAEQIVSSEKEARQNSQPAFLSQPKQPEIPEAVQPTEKISGNLYPVIQNDQEFMPANSLNYQNQQSTDMQQGYLVQQANPHWQAYYIDQFGRPLPNQYYAIPPPMLSATSPHDQHAGNVRMASPNQPGMVQKVPYPVPYPGQVGMGPNMQSNSGMNAHNSHTYGHIWPDNRHCTPSSVGVPPVRPQTDNSNMIDPGKQLPVTPYPVPYAGQVGMGQNMHSNSGMNAHNSHTYGHIWPDNRQCTSSNVGVPQVRPQADSSNMIDPGKQLPVTPPYPTGSMIDRGEIQPLTIATVPSVHPQTGSSNITDPGKQMPVSPSAPLPTRSMINRGEIQPLTDSTVPQEQMEASAFPKPKDSEKKGDERPAVEKGKAEGRVKPGMQSESEPMDWETSPTGGARQKTFKGAKAKRHSSEHENEDDTDSDDSDLGDHHRSWAYDDNQQELNFGFIKIVKGELASMKVDVIVNSSNPDLDMMKGVVSRSLATAGGTKIQHHCKKKYPQGIRPGDIAITKGGNLKCKKIFNCIIPQWDGGTGTAVKDLEDIISKCIEQAGEKGFKSIAFPAVGAGQLGFPVDKVATVLITTAQKYPRTSSVSTVVIVIFPRDKKALKAFERTAHYLLGPPHTRSVTDEDSNCYEKLQEVDRQPHYDKLRTDENLKHRKTSKHKKSTEEEHLYDSINPVKEEEPLYVSLQPVATDQTPIIRVTWTDILTEDDITLYFENTKKSGGGDIKEHNLLMEMKEGTIEFENTQTVQNILKKGTDHLVNSKVVQVRMVTDSGSGMMEERKVLINGLNPETTKDCLIHFLEAKADAELDNVMYSDNRERAVVTFKEDPDINKLKSETEKRKLEGHTLKISKVPLCRTVLVTGLEGSVSEDNLRYFFENKKRSGGEEVDKVMLDSEDNTAIVTFEDPKVAIRVADFKKERILNGYPIKVSLFYPFLKNDQGVVKLPEPIVLSGIDPNIIRFILNSKPNKDSLVELLKQTNAVLDTQNQEKIQIFCSLDPKSKNIAFLSRSWKNEVQNAIKKFFDAMITEEVSVMDQVWSDVLRELKAISITHPDGVAVVLNSKDYTVIVVGHKNFVFDLKKTIHGIVKEAEFKLKQQSEQVVKKENLKMYQIQLLWRSKFHVDVQKIIPTLKVEIDVENTKVILSGNYKDVNAGTVKMHEKLNSFVSDQMEMTVGRKELFFSGLGRDKIVEEMKKKNILVVWDILPMSFTLHLYGKNQKDIKTGMKIIATGLQEQTIIVKDHFPEFIASTHWHQTLEKLKEKHGKKFFINSENNEVCVTALQDVFFDIFDVVETEIKEFEDLHKTRTEFMHVQFGVFQFMQKHQEVGISSIKQAVQHLNTKLKICPSRKDAGFEINGTKSGIKLAKKRLQLLADAVQTDTISIVCFGAVDFYTSEEGRDKMRVVETDNKCVIYRKTELQKTTQTKTSSMPPVIKAVCRIGSGRKISVALGDMTKLKVDVMVNAANEDLNHGSGIAGAIIKAGGQEIQRECTSYVQKYGQLVAGKAVYSGSGRLPCKMIVHAVGPTWEGGKYGEETKLRSAVKESLNLARVHESVVFPALSAGIFGYPRNLSISTIVDEVKEVMEKRNIGQIKHVIFCDIDSRNVNLFVQELKKQYGTRKVDEDNSVSDDEGSDGSSSDEDAEQPLIKIVLLKGEIARTKADVIVNSTHQDLDLDTGALSKSILQHGGKILQDECSQNYPYGIKAGEIAVTSGGNLNCQQVYHGTFPQWDGGYGACSNLLQNFVKLCLSTAEKSRQTSIAFPALGAGQLRWPAVTVASIMFDSVMNYSRKHPKSSVTTVYFVVFPKDVNSVQAFEQEEQKLKIGHVKGNKTKAGRKSLASNAENLGRLFVTVKTGDITKEVVDAIVNSTSDHLDLTRGAISRAMLKAGGQELQKECDKQRSEMQRNGLIATTGGNMPCAKIFHVRSYSTLDPWEKTVTDCLEKAESLQLKSLAFPALGTGQASCDPKQMARTIFRAIKLFKGPTKHLKEVRIVIFQAEMADIFQSVLTQHLTVRDAGYRKEHQKDYKGQNWNSQRREHESPDKLEFQIWADSADNIGKAHKQLDKALEKEIKKEIIQKNFRDIIKELKSFQVDELWEVGTKHRVRMELSQERGCINVVGRSNNVNQAILDITTRLREYEKHQDKVQQAKALTKYVQWYFDDNGKMKKYNAEINSAIEMAYKNKQPTVKIKDGHGESFVIDFNANEGYRSKHPHIKVKVERCEKGAGGVFLPKSWSPMGKDESVKREVLGSSDPEFINISQLFSSGTGCQPRKIERIQNKFLYQQYAAKKEELQIKNKKDPEKLLWHGTSADTVDKIITNGFNRSYCGKNGTAYGNGVYFAVNTALSLRYCGVGRPNRHMFLVQVLTGETCPGQSGMTVLPARSGTVTYDSAADNQIKPTMYVIFHDSQAYPKYHITF